MNKIHMVEHHQDKDGGVLYMYRQHRISPTLLQRLADIGVAGINFPYWCRNGFDLTPVKYSYWWETDGEYSYPVWEQSDMFRNNETKSGISARLMDMVLFNDVNEAIEGFLCTVTPLEEDTPTKETK